MAEKFTSIQVYASFMDAIIYLKEGMHITAGASRFKGKLERALGLPKGMPYGVYAYYLQLVMEENFGARQKQRCEGYASQLGIKKRVVAKGKYAGFVEYYLR